jgi:hypothetical protein
VQNARKLVFTSTDGSVLLEQNGRGLLTRVTINPTLEGDTEGIEKAVLDAASLMVRHGLCLPAASPLPLPPQLTSPLSNTHRRHRCRRTAPRDSRMPSATCLPKRWAPLVGEVLVVVTKATSLDCEARTSSFNLTLSRSALRAGIQC